MTPGRTTWLSLAVAAVAGSALALYHRSTPPDAPRSEAGLRIVSLAPNVTEILFALGAGGSLVGATDLCDYPPEAASIPRVSGFGAPNVEKLLALSPDVILAAGLERPEIVDMLRQYNIRVLNVKISNFPEMFDAIRQIGEATDRTARAEQLVRRLQGELDAMDARFRDLKQSDRPRVFVEIEQSPLMTAGGRSFLNDLIVRAGGTNVAGEIDQSYPRVDPEKVIAWNPDVILVAHSAQPGEAAERLARHIGWSDLAAVRNRHIIDDINADLLFRPGPRLVEGVKTLAAKLHPAGS